MHPVVTLEDEPVERDSALNHNSAATHLNLHSVEHVLRGFEQHEVLITAQDLSNDTRPQRKFAERVNLDLKSVTRARSPLPA